MAEKGFELLSDIYSVDQGRGERRRRRGNYQEKEERGCLAGGRESAPRAPREVSVHCEGGKLRVKSAC